MKILLNTTLIVVGIAVLCLIGYENLSRKHVTDPSVFPHKTNSAQARGIDEPPFQKRYHGATFQYADVKVKPLYEFIVTARVLSKKNYSDSDARYAPTDLALGWEKMSQPAVIKQLTIKQYNRWFSWQTRQLPIPKKEIMYSAANMHLIPATPEIQSQIDAIKTNNIVQISGKLVNLSKEDGWHWHSSTTRKDSGNGACELVFVESVSILK